MGSCHDLDGRLVLDVKEKGVLVHVVEVYSRLSPHEDKVLLVNPVQGDVILVDDADILDAPKPLQKHVYSVRLGDVFFEVHDDVVADQAIFSVVFPPLKNCRCFLCYTFVTFFRIIKNKMIF